MSEYLHPEIHVSKTLLAAKEEAQRLGFEVLIIHGDNNKYRVVDREQDDHITEIFWDDTRQVWGVIHEGKEEICNDLADAVAREKAYRDSHEA